jgi:hypothetical protein
MFDDRRGRVPAEIRKVSSIKRRRRREKTNLAPPSTGSQPSSSSSTVRAWSVLLRARMADHLDGERGNGSLGKGGDRTSADDTVAHVA